MAQIPNQENYPSTELISGVQEVSEDMSLHIQMGHLIKIRLLERTFFEASSDYCVQASWQELFVQSFCKSKIHGNSPRRNIHYLSACNV